MGYYPPTARLIQQHSDHEITPTFSPEPTYNVVILDYKMPGTNRMDVAKEILGIDPHQRIIFPSAHVKETLQESVKQLKKVVELMQKPFNLS